MLKINKEFTEIDKDGGEELKSHSVIYSLMLRLKGLFLIKYLISKQKYSKKAFEKWVLLALNREEFEKCYEIYRLEKDESSSKAVKIKIETARKLTKFFEDELNYLNGKS
jgi:hypothetical protein